MDPVGVAFGITSAGSWGLSDFAGGLASRMLGSITTATVGQALGFLAIAALTMAAGESALVGQEVAWAVVAGVGGSIGLASLYRALAVGDMSLVAPLTGAVGAGVPVVASFAVGETVGPAQAAGIGCALVAVVVVSISPRSGSGLGSDGAPWRVLPLVVAAGLGFASFYLAIDQAVAVGGHLWQPLLVARASSLAVFVALMVGLALGKRPGRPGIGAVAMRWPLLLVAGIGDLGGNLFFVLANAISPLSIAVVLSSLYPVVTALLAAMVLGERLRPRQAAGALLALAAIVLIAA
jgi:drug/metabolite transporter (DMT)-like permease